MAKIFALQRGPFGLWMPPIAYLLSGFVLMALGMLGLPPALAQGLQPLGYVVLATVFALAIARKAAGRALGLMPARSEHARIGLIAVITFLAIYGLTALIALLSPETAESTATVLTAMGAGQSHGRDVMLLLVICVLAPLGEEALFRGLIFKGLFDGLQNLPNWAGPLRRRGIALTLALSIAALGFAQAHGGEGQEGMVLIVLGLHGVLYGLAYAVSGSLWAPVLAHSLNNCAALAQFFLSDAGGAGIAPVLQASVVLMPMLTLALLALWQGLVTAITRPGEA